jgi:spore coat polysaccharide biosynthesis protein SpsF
MKAGILLSVREKATRLPGKVLMPLGGAPSITAFLLRRLKTSAKAAQVILATSVDPRDDVLCRLAAEEGCAFFKGSEDDKMFRYRDAARAFGLDFVVIVDGDDPFISVDHIDRIIAQAEVDSGVDLCRFDNLALGATGFGLRTSALERVCENRTEENTEVWGNLFIKNPAYTCLLLMEDDPVLARPEVRMTLDYDVDYRFFVTVADALAAAGREPSYGEIMTYLAAHPEVVAINAGAQEAYEAHLARSAQALPGQH